MGMQEHFMSMQFLRKADVLMGRRLNESFLNCYIEFERDCCEKFGVSSGGVTEYINRLNNARFAPGREEVLPRLVRYRNIRNKMAHELGLVRRVAEISKSDIAWLKKFDRDLVKQRDPISVYLRKARRFARRRRVKRYVTAIAGGLLFLIVLILIFSIK